MPFDGSGTFSRIYSWATEQLTPPIAVSKLDTQEADVATALSNCILRDGTGIPTANTPWNNKKITGLADATAATDALNRQTGDARYALLSGATFTGTVNGVAVSLTGTMTLRSSNVIQLNNADNTLAANILNSGGAGASVLTFRTASVNRYTINDTGNHTIAAAGSGTTFTVNAASGVGTVAQFTGNGNYAALSLTDGNTGNRNWFVNVGRTAAGIFSIDDITGGRTPLQIGTAGNVTINAPSSGVALTVAGASGTYTAAFSGPTAASSYTRWQNSGTTLGDIGSAAAVISGGASGDFALSSNTAQGFILGTNGGAARISVASGGNVTFLAPASGDTHTINSTAAGIPLTMTDGVVTSKFSFSGSTLQIGTTSAHEASLYTGNVTRLRISSSGNVTINAPSSGVGLTIAGGGLTVTDTITGDGSGLTTLSATNLSSGTVNTARISGSYTGITAIGNSTVNDSGGSPFDIGFRDLPQSTNTSLVLTDRGKHVLLSGTTNTVTIPANGSVAFPVGSTIVLVNSGSGNTTLNITTDTLTWYQGGATSTGSRTIATASVVTLLKVASTSWIITGSGIS